MLPLQVFDDADWLPDAEFGCCAAMRGPPDSDFADYALVRLDIGEL